MSVHASPRVTIVTPSFQQAPFLEATIRSVLEQDHPDIEYMVVDGGSTDGSVEIIRRYSDRLAWWTSEPDRGQSDAIEKGWSRATGEIIAWLNSDDLYEAGAIARAVRTFADRPDTVLAYGACTHLDQSTGDRQPLDVRPMSLRDVVTRRGMIAQPATFMRAAAVRAAGGLNRRRHYVMDFDLWLRLMCEGPAAFIPGEPLAVYRQHDATKSTTAAEQSADEMLDVLAEFFARDDLPEDVRRARRAAFAQAHIGMARAAWLLPRRPDRALGHVIRALATDPGVTSAIFGSVLGLFRRS